MDLPPKTIEQTIAFKAGDGYRRYKQYFGDPTPKYRFFFILNQFPRNDDKWVVVTATSQVEKTVRHNYYKSYVLVEPHEYKHFKVRTALNCALAVPVEKKGIIEEIADKKIELITPLPADILDKCRAAIKASPTITKEIRQLVLGDSEIIDEPSF
jgi:hypothetical protein